MAPWSSDVLLMRFQLRAPSFDGCQGRGLSSVISCEAPKFHLLSWNLPIRFVKPGELESSQTPSISGFRPCSSGLLDTSCADLGSQLCQHPRPQVSLLDSPPVYPRQKSLLEAILTYLLPSIVTSSSLSPAPRPLCKLGMKITGVRLLPGAERRSSTNNVPGVRSHRHGIRKFVGMKCREWRIHLGVRAAHGFRPLNT